MLLDPDGKPRENNRVFPFGEPWSEFAKSNNKDNFTTYQRDEDSGKVGLDYAMARHYASRSGRFMTADPGHVGANVKDPQSWNAYSFVANDAINRTDPAGTTYEICVEGFSCFDVEDRDYFSYVADFSHFGYVLPWSVGSFVERSCIDGRDCVTVRYLERSDLFIREMAKRAEASNKAIVAFPIVTGSVGITGGLAANGLGLTGAGLTTLGPVATEQVGVFATKEAARLVIQSLRLNPVQAAAFSSAIARATASSAIEILKSGQDIVVRITRSGANGYQAITSFIDKTGAKQVIQKGVDAVGHLDHYHIKR